MREKLMKLIAEIALKGDYTYIPDVADYLLANGVIVPPCKVGDTLYVISQMKDKRILPFINEYEVTSIAIKKKSIVVYHEMDGFIKSFKQTDFGKTAFLTREEAEKALKGE
jgi:acyl dehydratase